MVRQGDLTAVANANRFRQRYYFGSHCLEMYFGYKMPGDTIQGKKLVALQVTPFRKYPN